LIVPQTIEEAATIATEDMPPGQDLADLILAHAYLEGEEFSRGVAWLLTRLRPADYLRAGVLIGLEGDGDRWREVWAEATPGAGA
jgi:hypothetical protein